MFRKHIKRLSLDNMTNTGLNSHIYDFSSDFNIFDTSNIIDIHKSLMKKHDRK